MGIQSVRPNSSRLRLKDKVALVTGSTRGIGGEIAYHFAEEGAKVVVSGRDVDRGARMVEKIKASGGEAIFLAADMGKEFDTRTNANSSGSCERKFPNNFLLQATIVLACTTVSQSVLAQEAENKLGDGQRYDGAGLEEIFVTARRREESLQDIPDSITAMTSSMIETLGITRLDDIVDQTSNLFMINDQDPSTNIITIRGITTNRNQPGSVAFVIDGVTQPDTDGFNREYFDLERIEVLKGPQGALYGKGAIGGVINIITKKPGNEHEGTIKGTVGNGGLLKMQGAASGPLIEDKLLYRLTASYLDLDGYIRNTTLGREADFSKNKDFRGRVIWDPSDAWSIDLRASYMHEEGGATWYSATDLIGLSNNGKVRNDLLENPAADLLGEYERTLRDLSVKVDYSAPWGTITSLTAYNEIEKFFEGDVDNTPLELIQPASQELDLSAWSQELRFVSPTDQSLRYIFGMFYQSTDRDYTQAIDGFDIGFFGLLPSHPIGVPSGILVAFPPIATESEFEQWAVYGQFNYDITPNLEISAALRYDEEKREQFEVSSGRTDDATFDALQPKLSLSYKVYENLMVYGSYTVGFKSGGFNPPPENFPTATLDFNLVIKKEETQGYELGFKSNWWEDRVRFNAAAFYTDYTNLQLFEFDPVAQQVTINAKDVTIYGAEAEISVIPAQGWLVDFSYGYTDSTIDDFDGTGRFDGNTTPSTPEYTANVGLQYEHLISDNFTGLGRLDWRRVGKFYWQEDNLLYTPGYQFIDLRLSLKYLDSWELGLWSKNVTDEEWAVGGVARTISPFILGTLGADNYTINAGRQVGLDLRVSF